MKNRFRFFILCLMAGAGLAAIALWFFFEQTSFFPSEAGTLQKQLAEKIPTAVLLWTEDGIITASGLKNWNPQKIEKGENPRWSPDGNRFVFTKNNDVWLMQSDLTRPLKIIENVVTETGTGAYWDESGDGIIVISRKDPRKVIRLDLATGKTQVIHDESRQPFKGYRLTQCAEIRIKGRYLLTFTRDDGHRSMIIDLFDKRYITNELMRKGDCEPAWSPDAKFIVMTRRVRVSMNRPIFIARFDKRTGAVSDSEYLIGKKRCHNASVSNDSKYVLYVSGGDIFIWPVEKKVTESRDGIQLTKTGKNSGPNLYVFSNKPPKAFR